MVSVFFNVDHYDTVTVCMLHCMTAQKMMKNQNINTSILNHKSKYGHNESYELIFETDDDYAVYNIIKD